MTCNCPKCGATLRGYTPPPSKALPKPASAEPFKKGRLDITDGSLYYAVHAVALLHGNYFSNVELVNAPHFASVIWC